MPTFSVCGPWTSTNSPSSRSGAGRSSAKDAETALQAGFTTAGGLGVHLARVVEEGLLSGPSIYAPGEILSQTGGHGDLHAFPLAWMNDMCTSGGPLALCDGIPACLKAVGGTHSA